MSFHLWIRFINKWILLFLIKYLLRHFGGRPWNTAYSIFMCRFTRYCFHCKLHLLGYRLNTTVWMVISVFEKMNCVVKCVQEPCCRSINYKKTSQNETNCEMFHQMVYDTSEKVLERNCSYDYVYLTNPQKV